MELKWNSSVNNVGCLEASVALAVSGKKFETLNCMCVEHYIFA